MGWDFLFAEVLPSIAGRSDLANEICAAVEVETAACASSHGSLGLVPADGNARAVGAFEPS
eukprot:5880292-Lingulodinium_polyedra.AAC.1